MHFQLNLLSTEVKEIRHIYQIFTYFLTALLTKLPQIRTPTITLKTVPNQFLPLFLTPISLSKAIISPLQNMRKIPNKSIESLNLFLYALRWF